MVRPLAFYCAHGLHACFTDDTCALAVHSVVVCVSGQRIVVAHPNQYGCCHYTVVIVPFDCSHLLAVFLQFIKVELICCLYASFYIKPVAQCFVEKVYYHWLCGTVGVESPSPRTALPDFCLRGAAIEIAVFPGYFVEDVFEIVTFCPFCFQGVRLNYQKYKKTYNRPCRYLI